MVGGGRERKTLDDMKRETGRFRYRNGCVTGRSNLALAPGGKIGNPAARQLSPPDFAGTAGPLHGLWVFQRQP
jgi:hypothetical protein